MILIFRGYIVLSANNLPNDDYILKRFLDPISGALSENGVSEIAINRPGEYLVKVSSGWETRIEPKLTYDLLRSLCLAVATYNKISVSPVMSAELSTGERVQIESEPVTPRGIIAVNIRRHQQTVMDLADIDASGAFNQVKDVSFNIPSAEEIQRLLKANDQTRLSAIEAELLSLKAQGRWFEFFKLAVTNFKNIAISGATGSGKTTFARSLINEVPEHERIVTFEEQHELILTKHRNKVHLFYGSGPGRISPKECLRSAMRMSPDRIFPAEIRSDEAWEYLQSLNSGHPGSITTLHANSAAELFGRLFGLVKGSPVGMGLDTSWIRAEIYRSIHIALHFENRKLVEVFYDPIHAKKQVM